MKLVIEGEGLMFEDQGFGGHVDSKERLTIGDRLLEQHIIDKLGYDPVREYPYERNIGKLRITIEEV